MSAIYFSSQDYLYQLSSQTSSPFGKRQTPVLPGKINPLQQLVHKRREWYELLMLNNQSSYKIKPCHAIESVFKVQTKKPDPYLVNLPGDRNKNFFLFKNYLTVILRRFKKNIDELPEESNRIRSICDEAGYQIHEFQTFKLITDKYDFFRLLESLINNKSCYTFDLIISCIIQYSQQYQR